MLTTSDVARQLGITEYAVQEWAREGRLNGSKESGRWEFVDATIIPLAERKPVGQRKPLSQGQRDEILRLYLEHKFSFRKIAAKLGLSYHGVRKVVRLSDVQRPRGGQWGR